MLRNTSITEWILLIPALLISFSIHELSHGLVAYLLGDNTAKRQKRITLNPLAHIDWIGFIAILSVGFGWAKPVPINPRNFKDPKRGIALVSLAGPLSNIILAFISATILVLMGAVRYPYISSEGIIVIFLTKLFIYNCSIAIFNLLPIPPLDGFKIVGAVLPNRWYFSLMRIESYGMIIMILLLATGVVSKLLVTGVENIITFIFYLINLMGIGA
ncbi:MAG: site-2 protease family protein [Eubacteriales bacterium]|nr:site-2 protease family protein [Eubacteriales bacterium]